MVVFRPPAVVGMGQSDIYRRDEVLLGRLAVDACRRAILDAGLTPADIDGIIAPPRQPFAGGSEVDGVGLVTPGLMARALKLDVDWAATGSGLISESLLQACHAVAAGACTHALVFRALHSPQGRYGRMETEVAAGAQQFTLPYGCFYPGQYGQWWHRYQHLYQSGTREQMATLVTREWKSGLLWPHGYWYQHPAKELTAEEYLMSRMVSSPLSIYDCDIPVQACGAFVVSSGQRALDLTDTPAFVVAGVVPMASTWSDYPATLDQAMEGARHQADRLWRAAGIGGKDIDLATLYDGFSIMVPVWLEAMGLCGPGEAFEWLSVHDRKGKLPINTAGGSLGGGRMHGIHHIMESVLQVTGRAGERQVDNASVAAVTVGPPGRNATAMIIANGDATSAMAMNRK